MLGASRIWSKEQILSAGIESRLGRYVRAEKGYAYDVSGIFSPSRHAGAFIGDTDTRFEVAADAVTAMFKVFDDMKAADVSEKDLADAKFRVAGNLVMTMETIHEQASRRLDDGCRSIGASRRQLSVEDLREGNAGRVKLPMCSIR